MAWAQVKGCIKENTREFNLTEVKHLVQEGFEVVTPERWAKLVRHVREEVEDLYWKADGLCRLPTVSEFTIQIRRWPEDDPNEESSSESSSEENTTSDTSDSDDPVTDDDVCMPPEDV